MVRTADMCRRWQVMAMTGWSVDYVDKLRRNGTLRAWRPNERCRWWYFRSQIESLLTDARNNGDSK